MTLFAVCIYLWTTVALVYAALGINAKKQSAIKEKPSSRLMYLLCLATGMAMIFYTSLPFGKLTQQIYTPNVAFDILGVVLLFSGIIFSLWARFLIGSNWSGTVMIKEKHELIQKGPYSIVRHPTYSGFIIALLGTIIILDQWRGLIGFGILFISFLWKIQKEERMLNAAFPEYATYQKKTRKILPFIY
jgi:protein-S-isoprenylcysteine O-methyltransferase Ste14